MYLRDLFDLLIDTDNVDEAIKKLNEEYYEKNKQTLEKSNKLLQSKSL